MPRFNNEGAGRVGAGVVLVLAALAALAGCDSSDAVSKEAATVSRAPRRGGVFRVLIEAPHYVDPAAVESVYDALPVGQIFDGLVALDSGLNIVPALADTWTISGSDVDAPVTCFDNVGVATNNLFFSSFMSNP